MSFRHERGKKKQQTLHFSRSALAQIRVDRELGRHQNLALSKTLNTDNRKEARSGDYGLAEVNTVDGVQTHGSRECGKVMRTRMRPSARTTAASVLGCGDGW